MGRLKPLGRTIKERRKREDVRGEGNVKGVERKALVWASQLPEMMVVRVAA